MDKLRSLQSFVRLIELGSFTKVAEERETSKSLVSKEIRALEDHLGVRLLHRSTRNLHLTPEGETYLAHCLQILAFMDEADAEVQGQHRGVRGKLKINAPMSLGLTDLSRLFADFMQAYPAIELNIQLGDETQDLVAQGFDLGFRVSSQTFDSPYVGKALYQFDYYVVASPDYVKKHGPITKVRDLAKHNCVSYSYHLGKDRWPLADGVSVSGNIKANSTIFLLESLKKGLGIGLAPEFVCRESLAKGELVTLLDGVKRPKLTLYALYPARHHLPPKLKVCIEFFQQWFQENYRKN